VLCVRSLRVDTLIPGLPAALKAAGTEAWIFFFINFLKNGIIRAIVENICAARVGVGSPASWLAFDRFRGMILLLLVILAYAPVWHAGFVWDDDAILTTNPCIVGPLGFKEIWTTSAADICPLTLSTFRVEHAIWGLNPLPYHLVNVALQGLNAVLLWRVLGSLRVHSAWMGAALWALHPIGVESVAWITEMKNTESGLFFLVTILLFVKWLRANKTGRMPGSERIYALSLLFAGLAIASKSSTVILPVVLCLCVWWIEGAWNWRSMVRVFPIFLIAICASALSIWTQGLQLATVQDAQWVQTFPQRLAAAGAAVWFYLGKLIWPDPLMSIYPRWQIDVGQWVVYLPLLAVIALPGIFWVKREPWSRACFFSFAYFATALLPVLGLIDNPIFRLSLVFDHFQYLASMGPLALAGTGLARVGDFFLPKKPRLQAVLCAGLLLILGTVSWRRTRVYESGDAFWTDELAKNSDCWLGHFDLGDAFLQKGQVDEAIGQFEKAVEINPRYFEAYNNLGVALGAKGQWDSAVAHYQKAMELNANFIEAHRNLGDALLQKGQWEAAVGQFEKVVELNPNLFEAHNNLGVALGQTWQLDEAIRQFREALRLKPGYPPARDNLARAQVLFRQRDGPTRSLPYP
jgi:protein O-mannosyl-transferase